MKKNILITGGFGLLGSNLYKFLIRKYNVYILDKKKNFYKRNYLKIPRQHVVLGSYLNKKLVKNILLKKKINVIFHTGAVTQVLDALKNPEKTYINNINGTLNFLECIRQINKKIIFIYSSSDKAYGEVEKKSYKENTPLKSVFPYDVSKACSDLICQSYSKTFNLRIAILRCGNLYGPGDFNKNRLIPGCIISNIKNKIFNIRSNGKLVRDYLYVDDAVQAYFLTMKSFFKTKINLRIYNVGSKFNSRVINLVNKINSHFSIEKQTFYINDKSKQEIKYQKLDYSKIQKELNWKQKMNIDNGIEKTINWYKNFYK